MTRVAVLGGGPAGAFAAERLASAGLSAVVLDEKLAWEKPCGGGLTYKAWRRYPFLIENDTPKKLVTETMLAAPKAGSVKMIMAHPLVVYSRYDLNRMLLKRAERAGASIEKTRVLGVERRSHGWRVRTGNGGIEADFCVVATGARNPLRNVGTELTPGDTAVAIGYYVPGGQEHIDIQFLPQFEGYIWVFPRCGHLSVGICGKGQPAAAQRELLHAYMREKGMSWKDGTFYSHLLPSLETHSWRRNRMAGEGWLAVGDAAGLCDPITGEGLYYALRSADLASGVVLADAHSPGEKHHAYAASVRRDFLDELEFAARISKRVFLGQFLFSSVTARMIQFTRRSPRFYRVMQDLFAGTQNYVDLKDRLMRGINGTIHEILMSVLFQRILPDTNQV
jgi:flavin-dependent dehydrogenase